MSKYLLILSSLLFASVLGSGYLLFFTDPFSNYPWIISAFLGMLFVAIFSFFSLFLFFFQEVIQKKIVGEKILKKSVRRAGLISIFAIILLLFQLFKWLDFPIFIGFAILFSFIEVYFSFLYKKRF